MSRIYTEQYMRWIALLTAHSKNVMGSDGVATNLAKLEYSGISLNMENSGNSVQPQGKIVTN